MIAKHRANISFEEAIAILLEARQPGKTISGICAVHGITPRTFVRWCQQFERLASGLIKRIEYLESENRNLEEQLAEREQKICRR